ncbi:MAG: N-acetyl-gamma-glutamyl-phosphate reductase [Rhizobiaceae bacterium]|nr:N-acetyl-gamma-glutamyl-phosphate reductase [Rhizobiaceae bacterium]
MKPKLFIDGEHGTTGLQIRERLARRDDFEMLSLAMEDRRDDEKRKEMLAACDIAILCLPDDAAREAVAMIEASGNDACKIIDTSTAHRTAQGWAYGFAELSKKQSDNIRTAKRVSNPGCYSTGAIALLKPLINTGVMSPECIVTINAVSGYTGGGKQLIAQMEDEANEKHIDTSFHLYALGLQHKHVPEIMVRSGLKKRPLFMPSVGRFAQGMLVSIPLHLEQLSYATADTVRGALEVHYDGCEYVTVASKEEAAEAGHIRPEDFAGRDDMKLWVFSNEEAGHVNLVAQLDNLGKGASGAAVQNLNLLLS